MAAKRQEVVGKDQDGRDVYADKSVVVPGSLRPDGTRRKDLRVRAEQRPDGSWRSFVPQDEVKKYEVRARRPANPPGAAAGPPLPPPLFKRGRRCRRRRRRAREAARSHPWPRRRKRPRRPRRPKRPRRRRPRRTAGDELRGAGGLEEAQAVTDLQARVAAGLSPTRSRRACAPGRAGKGASRGDGGASGNVVFFMHTGNYDKGCQLRVAPHGGPGRKGRGTPRRRRGTPRTRRWSCPDASLGPSFR